jgi:dipeptidyl aminopeptidase/acylaminoacyl peptidase
VALDERLRRELERAGRPADPSGVYEELIRRRERHRIARRLEAGALALVVFAATIGGFFGLTRVFRGTEEPPQILAPSVSNGLIVFSLPLKSGGEHLFGVAPDGSTLRQLTPEGNAVYRSPDVSPDGSTVVAVHEIEGFEAGQSVLVTVPITGGSPTWLSEASWVVLDPAWSPDGAQIAFAGSPGGPFGIYVFEVSTGDAQLVPGTDEIDVGDPTWSPDGSRIAFEAWDGTQPEQWDIYSARLDGSELTNLTRTPDYSETMPAWSWTHDRIAFIESGPAEGALLTMSAAGTDQMTAYSGELSPANPVWSPNGTAIAFEGGSEGIFTVRADGTGPAPLPDARGREPAWQALIDGATLPPVMPTPAPSPDPDAQDIGLGFPVCNLSSIKGRFSSPDANSTIFVATRASDAGGCAQPEDAFNVVALDTDQDGLADISYGPIECTLECRAFSAPDVDGDGTDEFLVVQDGGAVVGLRLYDFSTNGQLAIVPVNVAGPGDPQGGFEPSQQAILWLGGDAFELYGLQCGEVPAPDGPGVIATAAESIPHDSPDAEWHAHQTTLVLRSDGLLHVVDVRDFTEPIAADPDGPSFRSGETLCGSNLGPAVPTP